MGLDHQVEEERAQLGFRERVATTQKDDLREEDRPEQLYRAAYRPLRGKHCLENLERTIERSRGQTAEPLRKPLDIHCTNLVYARGSTSKE